MFFFSQEFLHKADLVSYSNRKSRPFRVLPCPSGIDCLGVRLCAERWADLERAGRADGACSGGAGGQLFAGRAGGLSHVHLSGRGRAGEPAAYLEGFLRAGQGGVDARRPWPRRCGQSSAGRCWPFCWALPLWACWACPCSSRCGGFCWPFPSPAFVRLFGSAGCLLAFLVFGVGGAVSVPALFVLGVQGLRHLPGLAGRSLGESKAAPPMDGPISALRRVRGGALCVCCFWSALRCPRWCPARPAPFWADRELSEKVLDGWIAWRDMNTI